MLNIGIVGIGMSGVRFIQAVKYLESEMGNIKLAGICDISLEKFSMFNKEYHFCTSIDEFCKEDIYDIVIVSTNESNHYQVLMNLKKRLYRCKRYIVEKPIVATYEQFQELSEKFDDDDIIVNYVERYSESVYKLKQWMDDNSMDVIRAQFMWGKSRICDSRPTMGADSEIVHPLDLCMFFAGGVSIDAIKFISCNTIKSDFSISGQSVVDTIDISVLINNRILLTGCSSFVWANRKREILLYLQSQRNKELYIVNMYFDSPRWDFDGFVIYRIHNDGNKTEVYTFNTDNGATDKTMCMTKIITLIESCLDELFTGYSQYPLHRINDSCCIQFMLKEIKKISKKGTEFKFGVSPSDSMSSMYRYYKEAWESRQNVEILDEGF